VWFDVGVYDQAVMVTSMVDGGKRRQVKWGLLEDGARNHIARFVYDPQKADSEQTCVATGAVFPLSKFVDGLKTEAKLT